MHPVFGIERWSFAYMEVTTVEMGHVQRLCVLQFFRLFLAVPNRNAVAPPELAADAPVLEIGHPMGEGLLPALGAEGDFAALHGFRRFLHGRIFEEPLERKAGLDGDIRAFAEAHVVLI